MSEILTTAFKSDTTRMFVDDVLNNDYYVFVSGISDSDSTNSLISSNSFLERTLFGKKILNKDVFFMIKYYPWQRGNVYEQYDDQKDLEGKPFYSVVGPNNNDTGDYRVYKCLQNNNGAEVSNPPSYNENVPEQIYKTSDGYVWKYIYSISDVEFEAYNALGYIPITGLFDVYPEYSTGGSEVSEIFVENPLDNLGYKQVFGYLLGSPFNGGTVIVNADETWNSTINYYVGQAIYLTNPNGQSFVYEITYYVKSQTSTRAEIRVKGSPETDGVASNAKVAVLPRIELLGDGTGAMAVPNITNEGRIDKITLLSKGQGYNNISVRVIDPRFDFTPDDNTSTDTRAEIRAILSPKDGHGFNLIDEFKCHHFLLYGYITTEENNKIGATNTYSSVGVVRNPEFANTSPTIFDNRIAVTTDDVDKVLVNGLLTQVDVNNDVSFSAKVHEVDYSSNTIYLAEYSGPYQNVANTSISLDETKPFRNESGQTIRINTPTEQNIVFSEYIQRTGKVYFMEDFFPLARTSLSREEFKFVLEF